MSSNPLRRLGAIAALLALTLAQVAPAAAQSRVDMAAFDRQVRAEMTRWHQPGLAIAVVRKGEPTWLRGYGVRDVRGNDPVDPDTLFALSSCSKPFAAAAIALLVQRGMIGWDDPVTDSLPWFRARDPWVTRALTIRDILSNRAGLRSQAIRAVAPSRRAFLEGVATSAPIHAFRANYAYASDMFALSGEVVAARTGTDWRDFARENFWAPLGMTRTGADYRTARADPDAATPHDLVDGRMVPIAWNYPDQVGLPAVGINSSVRDLSKWLAFQLGAAEGPELTQAGLAETREAQIPLRGPFYDSPFHDVPGVSDEAYALGWFVMRYHGTEVLYHHGSQGGFRCFTAIVPQYGLGFAALENSPNAALPRALFLDLMDRIEGREPGEWGRDFLARQDAIIARIEAREAALRAAVLANPRPRLPLDAYAGRYDDGGPIGAAEVAPQGDKLVLRIGTGGFALRHWNGDRFEMLPMDDPQAGRLGFVTFRTGPDGGVAQMAIDDLTLERQ
ncbi:serine hydrolase [Stakelama tenebrarum]|uniref:Serine hydrolase n=1 Tax=Stakelama tenebrarum TaxID=2711215 RepID=A0A6G6Y369_9SPHN|nr:serine hydrolase [Sphingosinithalassobacter tenebrarum]QIG79372.1 serine hydrolase [Sphingosinithalassobacter tenebrarum]